MSLRENLKSPSLFLFIFFTFCVHKNTCGMSAGFTDKNSAIGSHHVSCRWRCWLNSQTEEDRRILAAVTGVQVGRELLNRLTGQDKVDAYKVQRGRRSHPPLCSRVISSRCMSFCSVSSARLRPEHRTVPATEPASLAGADQRRGGEERPAVRHSSQSSGDGADSLSYSVNNLLHTKF